MECKSVACERCGARMPIKVKHMYIRFNEYSIDDESVNMCAISGGHLCQDCTYNFKKFMGYKDGEVKDGNN